MTTDHVSFNLPVFNMPFYPYSPRLSASIQLVFLLIDLRGILSYYQLGTMTAIHSDTI